MSDAHNYEGVVRGGPLHGKQLVNNASKGFVLVALENNKAWVHDYNKRILFKDEFVARPCEALNLEKLAKAQEDGGRSVMVLGEDDNG